MVRTPAAPGTRAPLPPTPPGTPTPGNGAPADSPGDVEFVDLDRMQHFLTGGELRELRDWLVHHGIDPNSVAVTNGWIERRPAERQIEFGELQHDERGEIVIDPATKDWAVRPRTIQLESTPSQLPSVIPRRFFPGRTPQDTRRPLSSLSPRDADTGGGHGA